MLSNNLLNNSGDVEDFLYEFEDECKIEFIDPQYLSQVTLDNENSALEYFYLSPFYLKHRNKALNELIRSGLPVDDYQVGLIFKVTYNNLPDLYEESLKFGANSANKSQFYIMSSVFHITLYSRDLGHNSIENTPINVYYIIQGSIFMCPPFGTLIRTKLHQYIAQFERFYDRINGIMKWSVTNGYDWNPKPRVVNPEIEHLSEQYNFTTKHRKDHTTDGNVNLFYPKPEDKIALRILQDQYNNLSQ
ncbi:MED6 mediator sub complex component family protein [Theileria parva strain Muguga]|uniref:Mediator of RNA polymerase II transcription subunit 6 n=1 Tax=Theileria parva TaxID=5875 RepID=Q4MZP1_THEPA|nr:MED6 mediator sub complex component family protein [Theileria parva strain Muguga]EAN31220.1 MED6 mediator sub complex component family protein [Theileria parva strain Muguga]|eukprot:XP_763503.1 hypothetical protein [Theileria parva strain Muguga]